jgi:hypothetical protein
MNKQWSKLSAKELLVLLRTFLALHTNNGGASKVQPITSENFSRFGMQTKAKTAGLKSISASDYHIPGGQYRIGVHENKINGFLKWQVPGSGRIIIP